MPRDVTASHSKRCFSARFGAPMKKNVREGITSMCPMVINHIGKITCLYRRPASAAQYG
jgi:hypothetical protein